MEGANDFPEVSRPLAAMRQMVQNANSRGVRVFLATLPLFLSESLAQRSENRCHGSCSSVAVSVPGIGAPARIRTPQSTLHQATDFLPQPLEDVAHGERDAA